MLVLSTSQLETNNFWSFHAFQKKQKLKEEILDNLWQKTCRVFDVLGQFVFTTNGTELVCYHQKVNVGSFVTSGGYFLRKLP